MKKTILLLTVALLWSSCVYAANISDIWQKLDQVTKEFIIIGYKEGLRDGLAIAKQSDGMEPAAINEVETHQHVVDGKAYKNVYSIHLKSIVSELDKFYGNKSNGGIPLDYAILYAVQKQNGVSEQELQKDLSGSKKAALDNKTDK